MLRLSRIKSQLWSKIFLDPFTQTFNVGTSDSSWFVWFQPISCVSLDDFNRFQINFELLLRNSSGFSMISRDFFSWFQTRVCRPLVSLVLFRHQDSLLLGCAAFEREARGKRQEAWVWVWRTLRTGSSGLIQGPINWLSFNMLPVEYDVR